MMNKFRILHNNKMYYDGNSERIFISSASIGLISERGLLIFEDGISMQFTGFQDKFGVDVYDGDIVKMGSKINAVKYFPNFGMFGLVGKSSYKAYNENYPLGHGGSSTSYKPYILNTFYQKRIEIIGNIYKNPELL